MKSHPDIYGTVTIGQRGQVVIPMKARKALKIKQGDQLIVMSGPPGKEDMISFIPIQRVAEFLGNFEDHISLLKKELKGFEGKK